MPRHRRPRHQGVVYGSLNQRERGEGGLLGRIVGALVVLAAVAVLGLGALSFVGGSDERVGTPRPTTAAVATSSPTTSPSAVPSMTAAPIPSPTVSPTLPPTPAPTPLELSVEEGPGFITFGIGRGEDLGVREPGTTFELGQRPFYKAQLVETTPTDGLRIEVRKYDAQTGGETAVAELPLRTDLSRVHTVRQRLDTAELDGAGIYVMRFVRADSVRAEGWFEVTE